MTRVKICGITNIEDAMAAVGAGADALGFVFAPSPRRVSPEQVRAMVRRLPPLVTTVGVFVDAAVGYIRKVRDFCGLDYVQLHGMEKQPDYAALGPRVIKALQVSCNPEPMADEHPGCTLLLDAPGPNAGGNGIAFDWALVGKLANARPVILAGGLDADNVGRAVEMVRPFAVDASSGVEIKPGRKDHAKIASFIRNAKCLKMAA